MHYCHRLIHPLSKLCGYTDLCPHCTPARSRCRPIRSRRATGYRVFSLLAVLAPLRSPARALPQWLTVVYSELLGATLCTGRARADLLQSGFLQISTQGARNQRSEGIVCAMKANKKCKRDATVDVFLPEHSGDWVVETGQVLVVIYQRLPSLGHTRHL